MPGGHSGHGGAHAGHNGATKPVGMGRQAGGDKDYDKDGKAWADKLSSEERGAVKGYAEDSFIRINESLRHGGVPEPETIVIDRALAKSPLEKDMTVFRGGIDPGKGKVFRDKGFVSTTMDSKLLDNSSYDAIWEISVPKGTNAGYVNHAAGTAGTRMDEKELLLQRGLKYKIISRESVGGKVRIKAEVVGSK